MTLPADITRCEGVRRTAAGRERCTRRMHCERYAALMRGDGVGRLPQLSHVEWACDDEHYRAWLPIAPAPVAEAA